MRQSYLIAKHVFAHVAPGTIKFVLIGLEPQSFCRDEFHDNLFNDDFQNVLDTVTDEQVDLNFDSVKATYSGEFSAKAIIDWQDVPQNFSAAAVKSNAQILTDYIELCLANGAKPVGMVLPVSRAVRKYYDAELLISFRDTIHAQEENHDFTCVDMFDLDLNYDCFCDITHLNTRGQTYVTEYLATKLQAKNLIPIENFCDMNYVYFYNLSNAAPKDEYNAFMEKVFATSAQMIRRKNKIKLAFVLFRGAIWCSDDLYNYFAKDPRFEVVIFICIPSDRVKDFAGDYQKAILRDAEQFKQRGFNVSVIANIESAVPEQDVIIFLTPYLYAMPNALSIQKLTPKTLTTYIPYALLVARYGKIAMGLPVFRMIWKMFCSSIIELQTFDKNAITGMPRGIYVGYPKMDIFFRQDANFHFDWKMARPDAKKIIYAPHWSIVGGVRQATFQWNYRFMYEFAKAHPEISWVVKPHPELFFSAVETKLFPSYEAFKEYLQAWEDLPNAQVVTGGYYQALFATSDGMIHDCSSFIAEYQYVDKPMIFLTREGERFNDLGKEILKIIYLVDGKDHDAIAATMQRVFIDGNDDKAAERRELFDKYLNYPKTNGMLASEFIYKRISQDLKG